MLHEGTKVEHGNHNGEECAPHAGPEVPGLKSQDAPLLHDVFCCPVLKFFVFLVAYVNRIRYCFLPHFARKTGTPERKIPWSSSVPPLAQKSFKRQKTNWCNYTSRFLYHQVVSWIKLQ